MNTKSSYRQVDTGFWGKPDDRDLPEQDPAASLGLAAFIVLSVPVGLAVWIATFVTLASGF